MKKAMLDALVTNVKPMIFDSGEVVSYSLEDNRSFILPVINPLVKKIGLGDVVDVTYASETKKPTVVKSGAEVDFYTLNGVNVLDIRKSEASTKFADLPDVVLPAPVDYTSTGSSSEKSEGTVGKV